MFELSLPRSFKNPELISDLYIRILDCARFKCILVSLLNLMVGTGNFVMHASFFNKEFAIRIRVNYKKHN